MHAQPPRGPARYGAPAPLLPARARARAGMRGRAVTWAAGHETMNFVLLYIVHVLHYLYSTENLKGESRTLCLLQDLSLNSEVHHSSLI